MSSGTYSGHTGTEQKLINLLLRITGTVCANSWSKHSDANYIIMRAIYSHIPNGIIYTRIQHGKQRFPEGFDFPSVEIIIIRNDYSLFSRTRSNCNSHTLTY